MRIYDRYSMGVDERGSDVLGTFECWRLLALAAKQRQPGHLGIAEEGAPTVLPVDYATSGTDVIIRVGEVLSERVVGRVVAFQVDGERHGHIWSVLVRGLAHGVECHEVGARLPVPRVANPGRRLVRIRSDIVTGRRFGQAADR